MTIYFVLKFLHVIGASVLPEPVPASRSSCCLPT